MTKRKNELNSETIPAIDGTGDDGKKWKRTKNNKPICMMRYYK